MSDKKVFTMAGGLFFTAFLLVVVVFTSQMTQKSENITRVAPKASSGTTGVATISLAPSTKTSVVNDNYLVNIMVDPKNITNISTLAVVLHYSYTGTNPPIQVQGGQLVDGDVPASAMGVTQNQVITNSGSVDIYYSLGISGNFAPGYNPTGPFKVATINFKSIAATSSLTVNFDPVQTKMFVKSGVNDVMLTPPSPAATYTVVTCLPVNGIWSGWGTCSATCGGGTQTRTCTSPAPSCGGLTCAGASSQVCNTQSCCIPVNGVWSNYGYTNWVNTGTCGQFVANKQRETRTGTKTCTNPAPSCGGATCSGSATTTETQDVITCTATINFKIIFDWIKKDTTATVHNSKIIKVTLKQNNQIVKTFDNVAVTPDNTAAVGSYVSYSGTVTGITPGNYDILIKGWGHMQKRVTPTLDTLAAGANTRNWAMTNFILKAGDLVGNTPSDTVRNNIVEIADLQTLLNKFDASVRVAAGTKEDLNDDGVVETTDLQMLLNNFDASITGDQ